jgi:photosystem II stability/assembly factor-like uncharacterized protein
MTAIQRGVRAGAAAFIRFLTIVAAATVVLFRPAVAGSAGVPDTMLSGLSWRLVGPHRAGWGTVTAGVPQEPDTFYFGAAGGGVWRTTDAGRTWMPIFDGGPASIGALAVAPSDPKTIYVGTGQVTSRYDIAAGEGVFKSKDGGASWSPAGLAATRHIGAILVDPRNADVVLVAGFGHVFGANPERGVFRSEDGGATWTRTLFVSENTGAVDLASDPASPDIVFASVWQVRYKPWLSYFAPSEGEESGLYRSSDGGRTFTRVTGSGWPAGKLGRIGLAAIHRAGTTRVYAAVEAAEAGGLYRSDDSGLTWKRVNDDRSLGNNYFGHATVSPGDPDTVFVMGRSIRRCTAGGSTCEIFKGSPGGDDYHHLWIDPADPGRMITGSDQGTVVTVNGGTTWSSWYNQPTGQLYHLAADDRFPYRIYAGQQDNGTVSIVSRSDYGAITYRDWHPVGADERDYDIPDPKDPDIVYGSGLGGRLSRWNARNGEVQNISPWPVSTYGARPTTVTYHYTWITPIAVSGVAPYPLYQGAQVLFRSTDQGAHWRTITPDQAARGDEAKNCGGDPDAARARACGYGVIFSIGLSPRDNDTIWIGTDDGQVRLTRDAGKTWSDVTPKDVPVWAKIGTIDVSATDPGTAYIAVDNHRQDDFSPRAFRTHDFGRSWSAIAGGLPPGQFVGVLRADPVKRGLLFAGTDHGVFVSFDDGGGWQPLQRNLPTAIVTDLLVHGNDLIASTQGRAIWVLDDVGPLRELGTISGGDAAHLFAPAPAVRVRRNQSKDTPLPADEPAGKNPPTGAIIDYWLAGDATQPIRLEIRDERGLLVRRFVSGETQPPLPADRYFTDRWVRPAPTLPAGAGAHRFVWDLRAPRPRVSRYDYSIAAVDGEDTPKLPEGMLVPPGTYEVALAVSGREYVKPLVVQADPRVAVSGNALASAMALSRKVVAALLGQSQAEGELREVRKQLEAMKAQPKLEAVTAFEARIAPLNARDDDDAPRLGAVGRDLVELQIDLEDSDRAPTQPQQDAFKLEALRLDRALGLWREIKTRDLPALNGALRAAGLKEVSLPPSDRALP